MTDLTRLSRSTKNLISLMELLESKGSDIRSLKEKWVDTTTAQGRLMFTILSGLSQFERDLISERTKEGLVAARARGKKGGRPSADRGKIETALKMYHSKDFSVSEICKMTGLSKMTLYRYINNETE